MNQALGKIWLLFFMIVLGYGFYLYGHHGIFVLKKQTSFKGILSDTSTKLEKGLTQSLSEERHPLLVALSQLKLKLLHGSITPKVEPGKADWLFLKQEEPTRNTIEQSLGIQQYTELELKRWTLLFQQREFWTTQRNMQYVLVFAPNKASIYPEYLPDHFHSKKTDTSIEKLKKELENIFLIDLGEHLMEGKNQGRLFQYTDTHWNEFGAFLAYQHLIQSLPEPFRDTPLGQSDFQLTEVEKKAGDLARLLLLDQSWKERNIRFTPKDSTAVFQADRSKSIGPNLTPLVYATPDTTRPRALFDHDSFGKYLVPFLAEHFHESVFLWGWQGFHTGLIKREKPDLVVDQFVERALIGELPRNDWEVIQAYWGEHFQQLSTGIKNDSISLASMASWVMDQALPAAKLAVAKIQLQPSELDKLIVDYYNDRGYYWLPTEGQTFYLEFAPGNIHQLEVEKQKDLSGSIELRFY